MKRAIVILAVVLVAALAITWPDLLALIHGATPGNKGKVYGVRYALVPGMTAQKVAEAVEESGSPVRQTWLHSERLLISAPVGFLNSVYLEIDFSEGRVVHARVRDDKGRVLPDAPKDF